MRQKLSNTFSFVLILALTLSALSAARPARAAGTISLAALDTPYAQDFDTLASSGTSSVVPVGWEFSESGTNANTVYTAGTGSGTGGDTYSFGLAGNTDRAFGGLRSGSLVPLVGAQFTNNTGNSIFSLDVTYTGEQWRLGQNTAGRAADRLDFQLSANATSLTTGAWTDYDALDFNSPVVAGTVGALNGNAAPNRASISFTVAGLNIPNGASFWLRWADSDLVPSSDDGLSVDDFTLIPHGGVPLPALTVNDVSANEGNSGTTNFTFSVSLSAPAGAGGVTFDIATANDTASAPSDYTARSLTSQTIPAGSSSYAFDVQVTDDTDPEPNETFLVNLSNVTGAAVLDGQGLGRIVNDDPVTIRAVQGAGHISPWNGQTVAVKGLVTALCTQGSTRGFYLQDPNPDSDPATSEGIFVFTGSSSNPAAMASVGDLLQVNGRVSEFRPGSAGLTITELTGTIEVTKLSGGSPLPAPVILGAGGRKPPASIIEDDASGSAETTGLFDPANDGLDFYESLEGMLVQVNDAVATGPMDDFGSNREISVIGDNGAGAGARTARGGVIIQPSDYNPERIILNDWIAGGPDLPFANVGDRFPGAAVGVMDYSFDNFKLEVTSLPALVSGGLTRESTTPAIANQLAVGTFNVENLSPSDPASKFNTLAELIVDHLKAPDILAIEEIQDNNGTTNDGVVSASDTYQKLIDAIQAAGGSLYDFRQINPVDDQDGGAPGGNIRVGFLFRTDRGLSFVDRPGGTPTAAVSVTGSGAAAQLSFSPGRIQPTDPAFNASRKPLAGEFTFNGHRLFVIANHFNSKGGDQPLFGVNQPPVRSSEDQRHQQAQIVHDFVAGLLTADPNAAVVVLGDLNDFQFSETLAILKGSLLHTLIDTLPLNEQYSYTFQGNAQALDHILISGPLFNTRPYAYDIVHVNAEFADQASDHDPQVVRLTLNDPPSVDAGGPYPVGEGGSVSLSASGQDPENGTLTYAWDLDNNGSYETTGQSVSFSAAGLDGPSSRTVGVQVTDSGGLTALAQAVIHINNVAPTVTPSVNPQTASEGSPVTASAAFSDPGPNDGPFNEGPFTCTVDYGDGSGVQPGTVAGSTCTGPEHTYSTYGTYPIAITVTDKDGSAGSSTLSYSVIFSWSGFFRPVDNLPTLNTLKAGSAVPLKFSLNGDKGLSIFTAGDPSSKPVSCSAGSGSDPIEETTTAGKSVLTYDPTSGQYTYTWKTEKSWAGTCRQLTIKLVDGAEYQANFQFTK